MIQSNVTYSDSEFLDNLCFEAILSLRYLHQHILKFALSYPNGNFGQQM